jgi:predicted phage terminase large subunit-like protein
MKRDLKNFYTSRNEEYKQGYIRTIYIENKGSGISLIQELRNEGLPISELTPTIQVKNPYIRAEEKVADKYTRFLEVSSDLESGYVALPTVSNWVNDFIKECEAFDGGITNLHDDRVDCLIYALKVRRQSKQANWKELKNVFRN